MSAPLNPQAPEYIPLPHPSSITQHFNIPPSLAVYIASSIPFRYPSQQTLYLDCLPSHTCNEPFYTDSFLLQQHAHFPALPPPPQEAVDVPPTPLAKSQPPVRRGPRLITRKNHCEPKLSCGRAGRGGSWLSSTGRGGSMEWVGRGSASSFLHEEGKGDKSRTRVKKHGILPLRSCEDRTTVMIKNVPNEYTRWMLVEFMDKHCMFENQKTKQGGSGSLEAEESPISAYDFLYLPIDFRTEKNKGYAFVNFTEPQAAWKFFKAYDHTKWDFKDSPKIRRIVCASIQGKEALIRHFQKSDFECESDEFLPLCFTPPRDGSGSSVKLTPIGNVRGRSLTTIKFGRYHQTKHRIPI